MAKPDSYYDEDLHDQDPRPDSMGEGGGEKEDVGYKTFLAPKTAFPEGVREVGAVHRVKTLRVLPDELELQCLGKGDGENEGEEPDEMYT